MDFEPKEKPLIHLVPKHAVLSHKARVYAFSDTHGCINVLKASLSIIDRDLEDNPPRMKQEVYWLTLGDMLDKGPQTRECLDALDEYDGRLEKRRHGKSINLVGNHEKFVIDFVNGPQKGNNDLWVADSVNWIGGAGGFKTLKSYGLENYGLRILEGIKGQAALAAHEICGRDLEKFLLPLRIGLIDKFRECGHMEYFQSLKTTVSAQHFVFCHAQILPDKPVNQHSVEEVITGRDIVKYEGPFMNGSVVVYGHSAKNDPPALKPHSIGIDPRVIKNGKPFVLALDAGGAVRFLFEGNREVGPLIYRHEPSPVVGHYVPNGNGKHALAPADVPVPSPWQEALRKLSAQYQL